MAKRSVIVIGCGIAGISVAHFLTRRAEIGQVIVVDQGSPMALTSAQSGENYRNWWPHPVMTGFTDLSISLMEDLARETDNAFNMTRRGYALATRNSEIDDLVAALYDGYADAGMDAIRFHTSAAPKSYHPPGHDDWSRAPDGVDILTSQPLIRRVFPGYDQEVATVLHIRRAGDIDSQQLGIIMLSKARAAGAERKSGVVTGARTTTSGFSVEISSASGTEDLKGDIVVNAAGPFIGDIGAMLGLDLPVTNVRQQKVAFQDVKRTIPRDMPFTIDLDSQAIDWSEDERALLAESPETAWLTERMPGSIHCKAEGGERGSWIKLGWAYNTTPSTPCMTPELDHRFPEIVLRGAARLHPSLRQYFGRLPRQMSHYGGYYTMTAENWPLIGPVGPEGSYVVGALSGFGTMAACASGYLLAQMICGGELPSYAPQLGLSRYANSAFVSHLKEIAQASVL